MRCYLIGFMGSGKTHWGRLLAERLGWPFVDLDAAIEAREGLGIGEIFARFGEPYFRRLEAECLRRTALWPDAVIATGGGTPCFFDNMDWMNRAGLTIFLDAPAEQLIARLKPERDSRPLLKSLNDRQLEDFIRKKLQERLPAYRRAQILFDMSQTKGIARALATIIQAKLAR